MATAIYLEHYLDSEYNSFPKKYVGFSVFYVGGMKVF